jgi:hypothetical protein
MTPRKLNISLLFSRSVSLSLFIFNRRDGGGEMVGDHAGRCRLRRSDRQLYSPHCNNRGKAAGLRR